MNRDWIASVALGYLPGICTVIFLVAFVAMIIGLWLPGARKEAERRARIPLDD